MKCLGTSPRLVAVGLALCLSIPASAQQTSRGGNPGTSLQKPAPPPADRRAVPPGRKIWDHADEPGAWIAWENPCTPVERPVQEAWEKQLKAIAALVRRQYEEFVSPAGKARRAKAIEDTAATLKKPDDQAAERRRLQTIDQRRERDLEAAATPKTGSPEAQPPSD